MTINLSSNAYFLNLFTEERMSDSQQDSPPTFRDENNNDDPLSLSSLTQKTRTCEREKQFPADEPSSSSPQPHCSRDSHDRPTIGTC